VRNKQQNDCLASNPSQHSWFGFVPFMQTMYQTTKYSPSSSLMPQRSASQAGEPWASASPAAGPTYSAGSPGTSGGGGSGSAAKQRLRWTPELHERFVDAVTQLGGPDREFSLFQLQPFMERSFDCIAPTLLIVSSSVPSSLCLVESLAALSQIVEFFLLTFLNPLCNDRGNPKRCAAGHGCARSYHLPCEESLAGK